MMVFKNMVSGTVCVSLFQSWVAAIRVQDGFQDADFALTSQDKAGHFERFDKNSDGRIERHEALQHGTGDSWKNTLDKFDTDRDTALSVEEFKHLCSERDGIEGNQSLSLASKQEEMKAKEYGHAKESGSLLQAAALQESEQASLERRRTISAVRAQLHDSDDFHAARLVHLAERFRRTDIDGDGVVTEKEFLSQAGPERYGRVQGQYRALIDADQDGKVSSSEATAAAKFEFQNLGGGHIDVSLVHLEDAFEDKGWLHSAAWDPAAILGSGDDLHAIVSALLEVEYLSPGRDYPGASAAAAPVNAEGHGADVQLPNQTSIVEQLQETKKDFKWRFFAGQASSSNVVRCADVGKIACASKNGADCLWGTFGAPGSTYKHGDIIHDDAIAAAKGTQQLAIPCPGWATFDGSDMCKTMDCYSDQQLAGTLVPPPPRPAGSASAAACRPPSTSRVDDGYADAFRGWFDVQGCGRCNDYCRWVGNGGSGGDPKAALTNGVSRWSCRIAGTSSAHTPVGHFSGGWSYTKCAGEGAATPADSLDYNIDYAGADPPGGHFTGIVTTAECSTLCYSHRWRYFVHGLKGSPYAGGCWCKTPQIGAKRTLAGVIAGVANRAVYFVGQHSMVEGRVKIMGTRFTQKTDADAAFNAAVGGPLATMEVAAYNGRLEEINYYGLRTGGISDDLNKWMAESVDHYSNPNWDYGVDYPGNDMSRTEGVASALACSQTCEKEKASFFTYGTHLPYTGSCFCKTAVSSKAKLDGVVSGACGQADSPLWEWLPLKGKTVRQSSTHETGVAERAVDGNKGTNYQDNSCTATTHQANPWWEVNLGGIYNITKVRITNRGDCCGDRLNPFKVLVDGKECATKQTVGTAETKEIPCVATGRSVQVQLEKTDVLTICEFEVFGAFTGIHGRYRYLVSTGGGTNVVRCAAAGKLACASRDGATCLWNALGGFKHGDVVPDIAITDRGLINKDLVINCPGWATSDGSDFCKTIGCYGGQQDSIALVTTSADMTNAEAYEIIFKQTMDQMARILSVEFCWRGSYDRGAGKPADCSGEWEQRLAMCYRKCPDGQKRTWDDIEYCQDNCPSGSTDIGLFCRTNGFTRAKTCCGTCWPNDWCCLTWCCGGCGDGWTNTGCFCEPSWRHQARHYSPGKTKYSSEVLKCNDDAYPDGPHWTPLGYFCYPKAREGFSCWLTTCQEDCSHGLRTCGPGACAESSDMCGTKIANMTVSSALVVAGGLYQWAQKGAKPVTEAVKQTWFEAAKAGLQSMQRKLAELFTKEGFKKTVTDTIKTQMIKMPTTLSAKKCVSAGVQLSLQDEVVDQAFDAVTEAIKAKKAEDIKMSDFEINDPATWAGAAAKAAGVPNGDEHPVVQAQAWMKMASLLPVVGGFVAAAAAFTHPMCSEIMTPT